MLISLQIAVLFSFADYIVFIMTDKGKITNNMVYNCLDITLGLIAPNLFLEVAVLMNSAKWVYYFFVIDMKRNIRQNEIMMEISTEREGLNNQSLLNSATSDNST